MIYELAKKAIELRGKGYSTEEIAEILNIHPDTVVYLLAIGSGEKKEEKKPERPKKLEIFVDRQTVAKRPYVLAKITEGLATYLRELIDEGLIEEPDVIVGFNSDGFAVALFLAKEMMKEVSLIDLRGKQATIEPIFAEVVGKKVLVVDDVVSSGELLSRAIKAIKNVGGIPVGAIVIINKSGKNEVSGIPLFSLFEVRVL